MLLPINMMMGNGKTNNMGYKFDVENHIHSYDGKPLIGTTTALGIISKPLTWWASGMACAEFGWKNSKDNSPDVCRQFATEKLAEIKKMEANSYMDLLNKAYRAHSVKLKKSAVKGTDMHELLEQFINAHMRGEILEKIDPIIEPFVAWTKKNVQRFLFSELHCFSNTLWTGGITDLAYVDMDGKWVLGDFKSSKEAYYTHALQVGGYDLMLTQNGGFTAEGESVFKLEKNFEYHAIFCEQAGLDKPFFNRTQVLDAKKGFRDAVNLYKANQQFQGFLR